MSDTTDLESYLYGCLLSATNGWTEEEIRASLEAEKLSPERIDFVMKVADDIMEISYEHMEAIKDRFLDDSVEGNQNRENVKEYLRQKEVREEYLDHIVTYNLFIYSRLAALELIEEGQKVGKSEIQIMATIKKELELDQETAENIYFSAIQDESQQGTTRPNFKEPVSEETESQSVLWPLLLGILFITAGILEYSLVDEIDLWAPVLIIFGFFKLVTGIRRSMDQR